MPCRVRVAGRPTADLMEQKRLPPRRPRPALERERVPLPPRRSAGARHPLVVIGNAVFTILVLFAIVIGGALLVGKQRFDSRGPLADDKTVNIPRNLGIRDIADLLVREGVIDQPWVFIGGGLARRARAEHKSRGEMFARQTS